MSNQDPYFSVLDQLREAIDSHDPAQVASCFTTDVRDEVPQHPDHSFTGTEHVLRNWAAIFAMVPDISASILRTAINKHFADRHQWGGNLI